MSYGCSPYRAELVSMGGANYSVVMQFSICSGLVSLVLADEQGYEQLTFYWQ